MISLKNIFLEGRYDRLTGLLVDIIWKDIKNTFDEFYSDDSSFDYDEPQIVGHKISFQGLKFQMNVLIKRTRKKGIKVDAYTEDDGSKISVLIELSKDESKKYSILNSKLQDTIRHEIEHITQKPGQNIRMSKVDPTSASQRLKIHRMNDVYSYFVLPDEIPAMVHGLYRKAKTDKTNLDDEMYKYLEYFRKSGDLTKNQVKLIMKIWIRAAKKLVPKAKYSGKYVKV